MYSANIVFEFIAGQKDNIMHAKTASILAFNSHLELPEDYDEAHMCERYSLCKHIHAIIQERRCT